MFKKCLNNCKNHFPGEPFNTSVTNIKNGPVLPVTQAGRGFPILFLFYSDEDGINWWIFIGGLLLSIGCCCVCLLGDQEAACPCKYS